jgi:hypothetical protein
MVRYQTKSLLGANRFAFVSIPLHSLVGEENQPQLFPLTNSIKGVVEGAVLRAKIFIKVGGPLEVCGFI